MALALVCHGCGKPGTGGAHLGDRCPDDGLALVSEEDHRRSKEDALLGRVLAGKYPIIGFLGAGAMGAVYRALQEPVGREVAIKVIRCDHQEVDDALALRTRFFREAKIVARLNHPSIVPLYDYGAEPDGVLFMALELVKGRRLDQVIAEEGPLEAQRAVDIVRQVLNALSDAHQLGLVHRDLKPENLMLGRGPWGEEQIKILDFGIAKMLSKEGSNVTMETHAGALLGTPLYMSPEQATRGTADHRSDLYALGVMLYEMLTGRTPFLGSPFEVMRAHRDDEVPPIAKERRVPPRLEQAVRMALAKEPDQRFQNAKEMADALAVAVPRPRRDSEPAPEEPEADGAPTEALEPEDTGSTMIDGPPVVALQHAETLFLAKPPADEEPALDDRPTGVVVDALDADQPLHDSFYGEEPPDAYHLKRGRPWLPFAVVGGVVAVGLGLWLWRAQDPGQSEGRRRHRPPAATLAAPASAPAATPLPPAPEGPDASAPGLDAAALVVEPAPAGPDAATPAGPDASAPPTIVATKPVPPPAKPGKTAPGKAGTTGKTGKSGKSGSSESGFEVPIF